MNAAAWLIWRSSSAPKSPSGSAPRRTGSTYIRSRSSRFFVSYSSGVMRPLSRSPARLSRVEASWFDGACVSGEAGAPAGGEEAGSLCTSDTRSEPARGGIIGSQTGRTLSVLDVEPIHAETLKAVIRYGAPLIEQALAKARHVHFAWFVFLEQDTKLALCTVYDGDFDAYIEEFRHGKQHSRRAAMMANLGQPKAD